MSVSHLEITEAAEADLGPKILHAFCTVCQLAAHPKPAPSMCGFKALPIGETRVHTSIPPECCVVCRELAVKSCERCGS